MPEPFCWWMKRKMTNVQSRTCYCMTDVNNIRWSIGCLHGWIAYWSLGKHHMTNSRHVNLNLVNCEPSEHVPHLHVWWLSLVQWLLVEFDWWWGRSSTTCIGIGDFAHRVTIVVILLSPEKKGDEDLHLWSSTKSFFVFFLEWIRLFLTFSIPQLTRILTRKKGKERFKKKLP